MAKSIAGEAAHTPSMPPIRNIAMNPRAKSIGGSRRSCPFQSVASQMKKSTPVGIEINSVVTQKADELHRRAGTSLGVLVELHGTDRLVKCVRCAATSEPGPHFEAFKATMSPPRCSCGGPLKPATISFGQSLCATDLERAADAATHADLVLALGSTLSVSPAASFPLMAAELGTPYIIINDGATDHDGHACVTLRLHGDVTAIVPPAVEAALALRQGTRN